MAGSPLRDLDVGWQKSAEKLIARDPETGPMKLQSIETYYVHIQLQTQTYTLRLPHK